MSTGPESNGPETGCRRDRAWNVAAAAGLFLALALPAWSWNYHRQRAAELRLLRAATHPVPRDGAVSRAAERRAALRALGFFGPGKRLERVETLRRAARALGPAQLHYTLAARVAAPGGGGLEYSTLRFRMRVRNASELLLALDLLRATLSGLPRLRSCELRRPPGSTWLETRCELRFYTSAGSPEQVQGQDADPGGGPSLHRAARDPGGGA